MTPAVERAELPVTHVVPAGVPRYHRGRWRIPVVLVLADCRRLPTFMYARSRKKAWSIMGTLPAPPSRPMFALVHRGRVVSTRFEVSE